MTVPSWQNRPESATNGRDARESSRKKRSSPRRANVELLETRQLLTFSASLAGSTSTFTVGNSTDSVIFSQAAGSLQHNALTAPAGENFADNLDFDSTVAGSQNLATAAGSTVAVQGTAYSATIGTPSSPASSLLAAFNLAGNLNSSAAIDDSGNFLIATYTLTPTAITANGINVGLTGPSFGNGVSLLPGNDINQVNILGDNSPLAIINQNGLDQVTVGNAGSLAGLAQPLSFTTTGGSTAVTLDDSADTAVTNALLKSTNLTTASLTNFAPSAINFGTSTGNNGLTIKGGSGADTQTVDFSSGNPLGNGLTFQGGTGSNTLILQGALPGGPFDTEITNATGPGAGNIALDGSSINFSGLKPVIDTTPATNFTFNYTGGQDSRISVGAGGAFNGAPTTLISTTSSAAQFEQESYANKTNVTINAGTGNNIVSVTGSALLTGSNTTIDGQGGTNTLNYDAGGATVIIAATANPNEATITRPGSGSLLVRNFGQINVVNGQVQGVPIIPPTITPTASLKGTVGVPFTNVDVATFTSSDPTATAASFGSTITWGDGTSTAGTIVPDATNPTVFHVEGSHTYTAVAPAGTYPVGVSVSQKENNTSTIPGVTISQISIGAAGTAAAIADASITATGATVTAVAGQLFNQQIVATFSYAGGVVPATNFNATVNWGDGTSSALTTITNVTTTATNPTYQVTADHGYTTFGTFPVSVIINSTGGSSAITQSSAIVTDPAITVLAAPAAITATEGTPFNGAVATFNDPNTSLTAANFLALITWGDGHVTQGTIVANSGTPGSFSVSGINTFAKAGSYSATVAIRETSNNGSTATAVVPVNVLGAGITAAIPPISLVETLLQPFTDVIGTFTSANASATASEFTASIDWGDHTTSAGTITEGADGVFSVTGSHTYTALNPVARTFTPIVTVSEPGTTSTAQLKEAIVTLVDAPLTAQGTTVTAVEGNAIPQPLIATGTYAGGLQFSTNNFEGYVNWGDGSTTPLTGKDFSFTNQGGPLGSTGSFNAPVSSFQVGSAHTYLDQGTFAITVEITSPGGGMAYAHSTAIVADALAVTVQPPSPTENLGFSNLVVATFRDAGLAEPASKYSATINYGDGTAIIPGTIVRNDDDSFSVFSGHKYTNIGVYPVTVTVTNNLAGITSGTANVTVSPATLNVVGQLNPASDSGVSHTDAITNDTRPNFFGTATPGSIVTLTATLAGSTTPVVIGSTVTGGSGAWSVTSITLPDGRYTIQATGTDLGGATQVLATLLPNALQGPLVVDTVAPKVSSILFEPLKGDVLVSFQDNSSGLDQAQLVDGANYSFFRVAALSNQGHLKKGVGTPLPTNFIVTGLSTTAGSPTASQDVVVSLNNGTPIRGGYYRFTIKSGGIDDVAGNALDGEFYGYLPSGNNIPGGDFVANLTSIHNTVFAATPVGSTVSPLSSPGTLPQSTFIPTVKGLVVKGNHTTAVTAGGHHSVLITTAEPTVHDSKSKLPATKLSLIVGKPTPHVKAKALASGQKPNQHHG